MAGADDPHPNPLPEGEGAKVKTDVRNATDQSPLTPGKG